MSAFVCKYHPAHKAAIQVNGSYYCQKCEDDQEALLDRDVPKRGDERSIVDDHAVPRRCFMTFVSNAEGWVSLPGTGCAHFVAHNKGIRAARQACCLTGFITRVADLASFLKSNGKALKP